MEIKNNQTETGRPKQNCNVEKNTVIMQSKYFTAVKVSNTVSSEVDDEKNRRPNKKVQNFYHSSAIHCGQFR